MKILIGGSPCTHWSIAQTKNRETEASGIGWELFLNYRIARDKYHPDYFLYENNKSMSPAIRAQITAELGVEPVLINSALVSAQNRQRLYWVGKREPDGTFKIAEYMHFCNRLLKKEPKEKGQAPAMIVFCAFEQMQTVIEYGKRYGFVKSYPLFFCKNYSAQVLKANMKIVGATEFAVVLYRDKLPKFRNVGEDGGKHMVFDWFRWERDSRKEYPKIHPTQKPVGVLKRLIEVFTDPGDVVIDLVAGSGTTLRAAYELGRSAYGFEVDKSFYEAAREKMLAPILTETTTI